MYTDESIITARSLGRDYEKTLKDEGLIGSVRSLFHTRTETIRALEGFDLEVRRGEVIGLIGPNGAGKTTLVKMLSGIMRPSSGEVKVLGCVPRERRTEFLSRIAIVMGQKSQLWWDLPAIDSFLLNKAIYGIPETRFRTNLDRLVASLGVESLLRAPVRSLSLGERMRMEFIAAMLHEPELVFLDEPTIGLDAIAQRTIRDFLRGENEQRGMSIVLTSHYMGDIRLLCPRTVLIVKGRKSYDGPTSELFAAAPDERDVAESLERIYGGAI